MANKKLDTSAARRSRGIVKTGIRAGAQTVHLKLKIKDNGALGESTIASKEKA
jgi:hypothetical protein